MNKVTFMNEFLYYDIPPVFDKVKFIHFSNLYYQNILNSFFSVNNTLYCFFKI